MSNIMPGKDADELWDMIQPPLIEWLKGRGDWVLYAQDPSSPIHKEILGVLQDILAESAHDLADSYT